MSNRNDDEPPNPDYEIGYGRPPKETQFQPGKSGNPKGRNRKPKSVQAQMQTVLSTKIAVTEGGKTKRISLQDVILRTLANKAAKGDLKAAGFVFNLLRAPEYGETDAIDQSNLSPGDQALFDQLMSQFMGPCPSSHSLRQKAF